MLSLVLVSLGTAFASDDIDGDMLAIDDEITVDEDVLAVEEDTQALSEGNSAPASSIVINNTNVKDYIDESGEINSNVTADELIFEGTFEDLNLLVDRPIKLTGDKAILINPDIQLLASNVTFSGFTINQSKHINAIFVGGLEEDPISEVTVSDVKVDFKDIGEAPENVAIEVVNTNYFNLINSAINYVGATDGSYVNNAISIKNSNGTRISGNKFNISLVSSPVSWFEVPSGSGNWVSSPVSEGIVIDSSNDVGLLDNKIDVTYNGVGGAYDTIYAVDFKNSDYAMIENNVINALGHTYIYGIILSGENFNINNNIISSESDNKYANGIDIEGPASGVIDSNNISVKGVESAYAIYSGMNGADVSGYYIDNNITAEAYNVFGMSLGDVESKVINNTLNLVGNYTTGIAYRGADANITGNRIILESSEMGNLSVWENFGVEAVAIKVIKGNASITDNIIAGPGKGVSLIGADVHAILEENFINTVAGVDKDAYAIYAENIPKLMVYNNTIDYQGTTQGTGINNAVYLNNANDAIISNNKFDLELVSSYVPWAEVPAGSGNWVSSPVSEGIVIDESNGVVFDSNKVTVVLGDIVGDYDTIYAVSFKDSDKAVIANNEIDATGKTYIYGIIVSGDDFIIRSNKITSAGNYYANGIDIEGPATGVVENNVIDVKATTSAYAIYSGMNGADVKANYTNNTITGNAYNVFGFSLGDVESNLVENEIDLTGNYATGIAYRGSSIAINKNRITLTSSEVGDETIWENFGVEAVGIKVIKGDASITGNVIAGPGKGVSLNGTDVKAVLEENFINVVAGEDKDAYAIYAADVPKLMVYNNTIDYQGTTQGTGINNAVYLNNANDAIISNNKFDLELVSSYVPWMEVPAGSGNWVAHPVSEGIVIDSSNGVTFESNNVTVVLGDVVGAYDTIYAVSFKDSDGAVIANNVIDAAGETYIYGIIVSGDDFIIRSNNITTVGNYYANGIDIEGPATGVVENNVIDVKATTSAYAIYSGMNGAAVKANYTKNTITGNAYNVFGFSLGDVESNVISNNIALEGNYTTGIAYKGSSIVIKSNVIDAKGSNVGNETIWENFGVETIPVKVVMGTATITYNKVNTTGEYAVDVNDTKSTVKYNLLVASDLLGDSSVKSTSNATVLYNYAYGSKIVSASTKTVYLLTVKSGSYYKITLKDANGKVLSGRSVSVTFNGKTKTYNTNKNGVINYKLSATKTGSKKLTVKFAGDGLYKYAKATATIKIIKRATKIAAAKKTFKAKTKTKKYTITLKNNKGKIIKKGKVTLKIKGKTYKATTNSKGKATFKITKLTKKGKYIAKIKFTGSKYYKVSTKTIKYITVKK